MLFKASQALLGFASAAVLARWLGAEEYGVYSFALAFATLVAVPAQLGLPTLITRETARLLARNELAALSQLWRWATSVAIRISFVVAAIMIGLAVALQKVFSGAERSAILTALFLIPLIALGNLRGAALRGLDKPILGATPEFIVRPFLLCVFALSLGLGGAVQAGAVEAMLLNTLAAGIAFIVGLLLLRQHQPFPVSHAVLERPSSETVTHWKKSVTPFAVYGLFVVVNTQADVLILGMLSSKHEVGIYRAAVAVSALVTFGVLSVNLLVAGRVASLYARGEIVELSRIAARVAWIAIAVALPAVLILVFFGELILGAAFGDEFRLGSRVLIILAFAQLATAMSASSGLLLNMTGHEKYMVYVLLTSGIIVIVGNALLVPKFGAMGSAVASLVALVVASVASSILALSLVGVNPTIIRFKSWRKDY